MIELHEFVLGPIANNTYLIADPRTKEAVIIDPSFDTALVSQTVERYAYQLTQIWITHAHFDHTIGIFDLPLQGVKIALHAFDLDLWNSGGGASSFNMALIKYPPPTIDLEKTMGLSIGSSKWQVLHTPGHTPGHVAFYSAEDAIIFTGDLIFKGSIGRTDLPGGDESALMDSIKKMILVLPEETQIYSGHGPATTVLQEKTSNPFLI